MIQATTKDDPTTRFDDPPLMGLLEGPIFLLTLLASLSEDEEDALAADDDDDAGGGASSVGHTLNAATEEEGLPDGI
jgi:hypothetical protein